MSKQRYTAKIMFPILEELEASGMSQNKLCQERGINKNTLTYWRNRWKQRKQGKKSAAFIAVKPTAKSAAAARTLRLHDHGAELVLDNYSSTQLVDLLKAVRDAR